ncbi:MAG TPA: hypothetical protein VFU19_05905 [Iamia sp.]|nr:hypothetical protein [Iamia sp.]
MGPRDRATFHDLPPWQQRVLTYLGLGVEVPDRPRWYRVLSAVAATVLAIGALAAVLGGRWFSALGALGLAVVAATGTRPRA